jgi:hypothetical protein
MRTTYKHFLFNKNQAPLYVDIDGLIKEGDPVTLLKPDGTLCDIDSPKGWEGILVKYARNIAFMALFKNMTVAMEFPGNAGKILKDQMWKFGAEAEVQYGLMKLDVFNLPYSYDSWYLTELNFYKYDQGDDFVKIDAKEGGLNKLLESRQDTKYRISLDTPKSFHVMRDGLTLTETGVFQASGEHPFNAFNSSFWINCFFLKKEGATNGLAWFSQTVNEYLGGYPITDPNFMAKTGAYLNPDPTQVHIVGKLVYNVLNDGDGATAFRMRFQTSTQDFGNQDDYALDIAPSFVAGETHTIDVDITIPLGVNEALYLRGLYFGAGPFDNANIELLESSSLMLTYSNKAKTTYSKELYAIDLLKAIVTEMTDGKYTAKSDWLEARRDLSYTSGTSIRNNGRQGDFIEMSLIDLFKDLKRDGVALGIRNNQIVIEPITTFFRQDVIIQLGEVSGLQIKVAEDLFFSKIRAGYQNKDYEDVNCIYEFNNGSNWQTPHTKNDVELILESQCRADPIGTEIYRITTKDADTTDNSGDREVFVSKIESVSQTINQSVEFVEAGVYMTNPGEYPFNPQSVIRITGSTLNDADRMVVAQGVNIVQFDPGGIPTVDEAEVAVTITFLTGGIFKFNRPAYSSITGIPEEMEADIYNTEITPVDFITGNGAFIRSICDYMDAQSIKFLKTDKEKAALFETILAGVSKKQGIDIQIGGLQSKLFKPYYLTFKTEVDLNLLQIIDDDPYGMVSGYWKGFQFYGFLFDGGVEPHTQAAQEWKLIVAPMVDMKKFKVNE